VSLFCKCLLALLEQVSTLFLPKLRSMPCFQRVAYCYNIVEVVFFKIIVYFVGDTKIITKKIILLAAMLFSAPFYTSAQYSVVFVSDGEDKYSSPMTIKGH